jgi:hypothetical protein
MEALRLTHRIIHSSNKAWSGQKRPSNEGARLVHGGGRRLRRTDRRRGEVVVNTDPAVDREIGLLPSF